jgi:hypothetical protein
MEQLSLEEGGELLLEIVGDHAVLLPMVSVPRRDLPEEIRQKFESRRGRKSSDIPLDQFLSEMGDTPDNAVAPAGQEMEIPAANAGQETSAPVVGVCSLPPAGQAGAVYLGCAIQEAQLEMMVQRRGEDSESLAVQDS